MAAKTTLLTEKKESLSFIETLLDKKINVKSQYDFGEIACNQCSWCAVSFGKNMKLLNCVDEEMFKKLYNRCILSSSRSRKKDDKMICGMNIDSVTNLDNNVKIIEQGKVVINKKLESTVFAFNSELRDEFFIRDDVKNVDFDYLISILKLLNYDKSEFILINRYGQSFVIAPTKTDKYLIMDSHCKYTGLMTLDNTLKYIKFVDNGGYNLILWILASYCESKKEDIFCYLDE